MNFEQRCAIAAACLPRDDYRTQLEKLHAEMLAAMAQAGAESVACVTECEACFTPDACQLRGTCDHYAASKLRIAPAAPAPLPAREPLTAARVLEKDAACWRALCKRMDERMTPVRSEWRIVEISSMYGDESGVQNWRAEIEAALGITVTPAAKEQP